MNKATLLLAVLAVTLVAFPGYYQDESDENPNLQGLVKEALENNPRLQAAV